MTRTDASTPVDASFARYVDLLESATDAVEGGAHLEDAAERMAAVEVGETPSEVVYRENKLELHRYEPADGPTEPIPLVIVYALINRPYILDLQPDRSVIRQFVDAGFTVYLIDWGEPTRLDASLGLDDYVLRYMDNCVDVVRETHDRSAVHVLGYCMGGTMSAMYAAIHPGKVERLGLMAAGLCFDGSGGVLERWGDAEYFDPETVVETYGNVPSSFLDVGFALMDPVDNFVTKYVTLADNLDDEAFVENFARMERWLGDGIDVAGRAYVQFLEWIYQENRLYEDRLELDGHRVALDRIDMPVAQIVGTYDHLIPAASSRPFTDVIGSEQTVTFECSTGHIGLSVSGRAHGELWPDVIEWYRDAEDGASLEAIEGVGPAYADRLRAAGYATPAALAAADPDDLAASVDVPAGRLEAIVERARELA